MTKKLKLVGCARYNFRGELYEQGKVYLVGSQKAELMMRATDEFDRPYFVEYQPPTKSDAQKRAEAAAAAAVAAAEAEEAAVLVERPDESGDPAPEMPDADAAVEVDFDDDPELDKDIEGSAEEISVDDAGVEVV